MDRFITLKEISERWGLSERRVRTLCKENRVEGAVKFGKSWAIPEDAIKPSDARIKTGKYIKHNPDEK